LKVLGKRPDGYHEIESLMQAIDLYDEIGLEKSDMIELACDDPGLAVDDSNLAVKAALTLQERFYFPGVRIDLKKYIPCGAGLGGGSSDAAFVLRGLCRLFGFTPTLKELSRIASEIGSDVPFFLGGGQARVTGRGEIVEKVSLPVDYMVVLVVPSFSISTAEVYGDVKFNLTKVAEPIFLKKRINISRFKDLVSRFGNDLERVVFDKFPELSEFKTALSDAGAIHSAMTGSGSALFGIFVEGKIDRSEISRRIMSRARVIECKPTVLPIFGAG